MSLHDDLWKICRDKKLYETGEDTDQHRLPDCGNGYGCKWFAELDKVGDDWGVCFCPLSPRAGLLTFEHMGCKHYEELPETETSHFAIMRDALQPASFTRTFNPQPKPEKKKR